MNALGAISVGSIKRLDAVKIEGETVIIQYATHQHTSTETRLSVVEAHRLLDRLSGLPEFTPQ